MRHFIRENEIEYALNDSAAELFDAYGYTYDRIRIPNIIEHLPVNSITSCAFFGNLQIKNVYIPNSVKRIESSAFSMCFNLKKIVIPNSVTYIGRYAFSYTSLKKNVLVKATHPDMKCINYQYAMNTWFEEPEAHLCRCGFHFCENPFDIFQYYSGAIGRDIRLFEVEVDGVSPEKSEDSKRVCKRIKFVREFKSYAELLN